MHSQHESTSGDEVGAGVGVGSHAKSGAGSHGSYSFVARDSNGDIKWVEEIPHNLVVDQGLNHVLDAVLAAGTQITSWYLGLTDGTPTAAAGDTPASHAGWAEVTSYSEGTRPAFTPGSVAAKSVDNSASKASFAISGTVTIGGAFLISNSTKGGTTGTLYSVGAFSGGDRALQSGDTLEVTATFTQAAV